MLVSKSWRKQKVPAIAGAGETVSPLNLITQ
jgi:hypothetical protein